MVDAILGKGHGFPFFHLQMPENESQNSADLFETHSHNSQEG